MPFIPRQVKPPARLALTCKVPEETATLLKRYAEFLDSTQEYVVNETLCVSRSAATRSFRRGSPRRIPRARGSASRRRRTRGRGGRRRAATRTVMSFEVILPFLRPIAHLILDPPITEIMVNGSGRIFVEREGRLEAVADVTVREQNLRVAVRNLARALGDDISEERPLLDSRLPDGSRVAAALPPVSLGGTTLTIRKFQSRHFTADELVRIGTLTRGRARHRAAGDRGARQHPDQRRHRDREDHAAQRADRLPPAGRPAGPDRRHRGAAAGRAEPGAVRGASRTDPACRR